MLERSKMVFSANLQETLGISCYEAVCAGSIPLVPDRLSYTEMYHRTFVYPSDWTESIDAFHERKHALVSHIRYMMNRHDEFESQIAEQAEFLHEQYFSCNNLLKVLNGQA